MGGEGEESALWEEVTGFGFDGGAVKKVGRVGVLEGLGVVILSWGVYFLWDGSFCVWLVARLDGLVLLLG